MPRRKSAAPVPDAQGRGPGPVEEPFVGRERELERLQEALRRVAEGSGCVQMLAGEPGAGKTRLAEELAARAQSQGFDVLTGRCYEAAGAPAYWPWVQALRPLIAAAPVKELAADFETGASVPPARRDPWLPLLVLAAEAPGPAVGRPALGGRRVAAPAPVRGAGNKGSRLLMLGTYRDVELERKHPLAATLGDLVRERLFERHVLRGLSLEDVERYLAAAGLSGLARTVHELTDGNALFVSQLTRYLGEQGREAGQDVAEWLRQRLPEGPREVIGRRLDGLSEGCNRVLEVASLFERMFGVKELAAVLGEGPDAVLRALDEASGARVIVPAGGVVWGHRFSHEVIRETIRSEIPLARRVGLHARIGEALEAIHGERAAEHAVELAAHFGAAAPVLGPERQARYELVAAEQALAAQAFEDSLRHARAGMEALKGRPMDDLQASLLFAAARAGSDLVAPSECLEWYRRAFTHYERTGNTEAAIAVVCPLPALLGLDRDLYERALSLTPAGSVEQARILAGYGEAVGYCAYDYAEACRRLEEASRIAKEQKDTSLEMEVLGKWAGVDMAFRRDEDRAARLSLALGIAVRVQDARDEIRARLALLPVLPYLGRIGEAERHAQASLELAEHLGERGTLRKARTGAASLALVTGQWDRAKRMLDLIHQDAPGLGPDQGQVLVNWRVQVEYLTGHMEAGRAWLDRALEILRAAPRDSFFARQHGALSIVFACRSTGDTSLLPEARRVAEATLRSPPNPAAEQNARTILAEVAWLAGDLELAREQYEQTRESEAPGVHDEHWRGRGLLARMMGKPDEAVEHLRAARLGNVHPTSAYALICCELAEALLERGGAEDRTEVVAVLEEALAEAEAKGMPPTAARARAVLEGLRGGPASRPAGLSERELEVLRLLAAGKSNKEIAFELSISDKTVHSHVASIFGKIGVSNRTEAAAYALKHGLAGTGH